MDFVTRAQRGAPEPKGEFKYIAGTQGVKIHYEGTAVPADLAGAGQHHRCAARVNAIERSHLANTAEGYISIAYSAMVCPHGTVYEGRGAHAKCGANGNSALNTNHYAVCAMLGDSGLTEPTEAMLNGLVDAIEWLRRDGGAGPEIRGHRDGYATSCPGEPLYAWVRAGAPRPTTAAKPPTPEGDFMDQEARDWFGLIRAELWDNKYKLIALQSAIAALTGLLAQQDNDLTAEQIEAAVQAGIAAGLKDGLRDGTVSVDINVHGTTPQPPATS